MTLYSEICAMDRCYTHTHISIIKITQTKYDDNAIQILRVLVEIASEKYIFIELK